MQRAKCFLLKTCQNMLEGLFARLMCACRIFNKRKHVLAKALLPKAALLDSSAPGLTRNNINDRDLISGKWVPFLEVKVSIGAPCTRFPGQCICMNRQAKGSNGHSSKLLIDVCDHCFVNIIHCFISLQIFSRHK